MNNTELIAQARQAAVEIASMGLNGWGNTMSDLADALEAAQAGEPVAFMHVDGFAELAAGKSQIIYPKPANMGYAPLHRHPAPQVPMADREILADKTLCYYFGLSGGRGPVSGKGSKIVRAVEAHHGIGKS